MGEEGREVGEGTTEHVAEPEVRDGSGKLVDGLIKRIRKFDVGEGGRECIYGGLIITFLILNDINKEIMQEAGASNKIKEIG